MKGVRTPPPPPAPPKHAGAAKSMPPPTPLPQQRAPGFKDPHWGAERLASLSIFKHFNKDELKQLYQTGKFQSFKAKTYAIIEGENSRGLYIILKGSVSVYKTEATTGAMHRIAVLEEGQHFGELSLFDNYHRTASVAAETLCQMFYLDFEAFDHYLKQRGPDLQLRFYKACAEDLVGRFRGLNSDYIASQQLLWRYALRRAEGEDSSAAKASALDSSAEPNSNLTATPIDSAKK